jgi:hypothetical protein
VTDDESEPSTGRHGYGIQWPPSPKMQIVLIALAFGLLNVILLVIWAVALYLSR